MTVSRAQMSTHRGRVFSKLSADLLVTSFQLMAGSFQSEFLCDFHKLLFEVSCKFIYGSLSFSLGLIYILMIVPLTAIDRPLLYFVMGIMAFIFSVAQIYLVFTLTACLP